MEYYTYLVGAPNAVNYALKRWPIMVTFLDQLAHAGLVVTRRLHAALPAAGFGTPAVCIPDRSISIAKTRFRDYQPIRNLTYSDDRQGMAQIDWRKHRARGDTSHNGEGLRNICRPFFSAPYRFRGKLRAAAQSIRFSAPGFNAPAPRRASV